MPLWIVATLTAAFLQNIRYLLQKKLRDSALSTGGATAARFVYDAPWAVAAAVLLTRTDGWPPVNGAFWAFALGGGLAQILGTGLTVSLFTRRNFAVGMAFIKTETIQVVVFSAVILGESVSPMGLVAILVGVAGIVILSRPPDGLGPVLNRATMMGIAAGAAFGLSSIGYRGAALALPPGDAVTRAAVVLATSTVFQALVVMALLAWREPGELGRLARAWRIAGVAGLTGMMGSLGWFTAFALQNAAYVRALGQVEIVFNLASSRLVLRERLSMREAIGTLMVVGSLVLLILSL